MFHYNKDSNRTASKNDFSVNGAISNDIDFMIYIGHGITTSGIRGNYLHYSCATDGSYHTTDCNNDAYNIYNTEVKFGSLSSELRWVWIYSCNFLKENAYVDNEVLKLMMNGVHIVLGYKTQAYLCDDVVDWFGKNVGDGNEIIESFLEVGQAEQKYTDIGTSTILTAFYMDGALNETIYSLPVYYGANAADVKFIEKEWPGLKLP